MIKNNVYYEWFASMIVPNPDLVGYWIDLGADSKGRVIKVYNHDIKKWVVLLDLSKNDYVPPFIGSNGNWWVDNRDTGVKATAETPYIGDNDHWFTYDPINKVYVDTGIEARGLSAYEVAVKLGYEGSEQDWIDSLSKASEDAAVAALEAANKALEATDKANQAVEEVQDIIEDAVIATDKAEEIASNPPKIVDNEWWIYDYSTKKYVNTGISAIGDAFTYKKEYPSVLEMESDWGTADVKFGEYVLINTDNVEDPDDAKVFLKTQQGWKFIVDLSGMQGIQGWSAYEVAVRNGFDGTEAEWLQSLKQPAIDAAIEALDAKDRVEATERAIRDAEALRVIAEENRVNAENARTINENIRITNENSRNSKEQDREEAEELRVIAEDTRKSEEEIRKTNEANRIANENSRNSAEELRALAEAERNTNEQERIANENKRISNENERIAAENSRKEAEADREITETARDTAEQERQANEAVRQANEAVRETQEDAREKNTADAIDAVNEAKTAAQQATTNAITAANNANTQADRAKEHADNPPKVGEGGFWYSWDDADDIYVNTGWHSAGFNLIGKFDTPEELNDVVDPQASDAYVVGLDLYVWNGTEWLNLGPFQGPKGDPGEDGEVTKAAIEAVLVGEVTTHTHDTRYYTKNQSDANLKVVTDNLANNYYNKSQIDSKFTSVYVFKGSVDEIEDLPTEDNVIGDVWNVRKSDTNYAWTSEGWDALGGTAELASLTSNGLMSKEDFAKLRNIEAGAQVNKIETITKRVLLNVVDKNVTIPEDIKISETEPTEEEIIWLDPSEDYGFAYDGYSQAQADARFVQKKEGKDLSTNDYTNVDKTKVANLTDYVTGGASTVADANKATITLAKKNPVDGSASTETIIINKATTTTAGMMSAADKTKLEGLRNYDDSAITQSISNLESNKLETIEVTGTGNVITAATKNGTKIAFAKGITAMTQTASDARYVKKAGDTMTGNLILNGTQIRQMHGTTTGGSASGIRFYDANMSSTYSFGSMITFDGSEYVPNFAYVGWGDSPWLAPNNLSVGESGLLYKNNKIWHAGNDGSGSGLDADILDGHHAGYENSNVALYANFPTYSTLMADGLLRGDYTTAGHPTVDYLQAICKWTIRNYKDKSGITIQGRISPNSHGWCVISLYSNNGFDETTLLPKYCSAQYNALSGESYLFGTYNAVWYCNQIVTSSNIEDTLAYWYENNENNASTKLTTGGNRNVIESLKSKFKRCLAMPYGDDAAMISYFREETSSEWPDGTSTTITSNNQNRMVHFPKYYHKTVEMSPGIWRTYISEQQIDSDYIEEPEALLATFEGAFNSEGKLISVANQFSASSKTITEFVTAAKVHGPLWGIGNYRTHATIARMFCAYYGNTNISTSNSSIPCSGGTKRYNYGKTGGTFDLGNRDGKAPVTEDPSYYSTNFLGLEDCYYSKWEFVQGINVLKGKYVTYDGGSFPDKDVTELEAAGATNIRVIGYEPNPDATAAYNGWIKAIAQGKYGDVVPTAHGGSETTYYSDYSWYNPTANRIFLRSGGSGDGSRCGVFMASVHHTSSFSETKTGARLAFYGKIVVVDSDTFKKHQ